MKLLTSGAAFLIKAALLGFPAIAAGEICKTDQRRGGGDDGDVAHRRLGGGR